MAPASPICSVRLASTPAASSRAQNRQTFQSFKQPSSSSSSICRPRSPSGLISRRCCWPAPMRSLSKLCGPSRQHLAAPAQVSRSDNAASCRQQLEKADNGRWEGNAGYDPNRALADQFCCAAQRSRATLSRPMIWNKLLFAERALRNIWPDRGSLWLDVGRPDNLAPLLRFIGDQLAEVGGRARKHRAAEVSEPRFHVG